MVPSLTETPLDLLDRQKFVDKMIQVTETLSEKKKNASYAINGSWGVGKTFVLNMFEEQILSNQSEVTATDKYLLFHFNCWNYDYYEEPLMAIVASILDQIEEKEHIIPKDIRKKSKGILKLIGNGLFTKAVNQIGKMTGVPLNNVIEIIKKGDAASKEELDLGEKYDVNYTLKNTLQELQKAISFIAQDRTVLFVVDELDRCLPEYAIKVLERLHHVFEDIDNLQLIISVDKRQFGHVIKEIYGKETDVDKYLAKFIDFELKLDEGNINDNYDTRFNYYLQNFDYINDYTKRSDILDFNNNIFNGMDMRARIKIIDKCNLIHNLLNEPNEKMDFSFMCIEIAFVVMKYWGIDLFANKPAFYINEVFKTNEKHTGLTFLNQIYKKETNNDILYYKDIDFYNRNEYVYRGNIWGVILSCYRYVIGYKKDLFDRSDMYGNCEPREYSEKFRDLLYIIN